MRIGIVGAGRIGGNCAAQFAKGGHEVKLSFSRDPSRLEALAAEIGKRATVGTPAEAAEFGEVVVLSVPWDLIDEAIEQAGSLDGKIVIDTTNQYGSVEPSGGGRDRGATQRRSDARRSLHEELQHAHLRLPGRGRRSARAEPCRPVGLRGRRGSEARRDGADRRRGLRPGRPRRNRQLRGDGDAPPAGAVYGEEYRLPDAEKVAAAVKAGEEIPPTPSYG